MRSLAPLFAAPALAAATLLLYAQDRPAERGKGKVLLLRSERVLEGEIERVGSQYCVRRGGGESWVAADQTVRLFADWDELFRHKRSRTNLGDPDERLRLALWCQRNGMKSKGLVEARAALEMRPRHIPTQRLVTLLERSLRSQGERPHHEKVIPAGASRPVATPTLDLTADAINSFTTRVQPILANACSRCHIGGSGKFDLVRVNAGDERVAALHNASAALANVNADNAALSPLLIKAVSPHGGARQPPLKSPSAPAFVTLRRWVEQTLASNPHLRTRTVAPANISTSAQAAPSVATPPAASPMLPALGKGPAEISRPQPRLEVTAVPPSAAPTTPATLPASVRQSPQIADPDDPYDVSEFNRRLHPDKQ